MAIENLNVSFFLINLSFLFCLEHVQQWKKPSRFEVVLCKPAAPSPPTSSSRSEDDDEPPPHSVRRLTFETSNNSDQNFNDLAPKENAENEPKIQAHFSLCCNDGISTLPMIPKKTMLLPERYVSSVDVLSVALFKSRYSGKG